MGSALAAVTLTAPARAAWAEPVVRAGTGQVQGKGPEKASPPADELARLTGQRVEVSPDGRYRIVDVAGEGAPLVGVVERRGRELWLRAEAGPPRRLGGPLARPRIAGPGYKIWALGAIAPDGTLIARRLGVLARPARSSTAAAGR